MFPLAQLQGCLVMLVDVLGSHFAATCSVVGLKDGVV